MQPQCATATGFTIDSRRSADVERLRANISAPLPRARVVSLVMLSGLPGAGKSYFSRRIALRYPLMVLESDALRNVLVGAPTHIGAESRRLFQALHDLMVDLLSSRVPVLLDATNLIERNRIAEDAEVRLLVVEADAPEETIYNRLKSREDRPDPNGHSDAGWEVYQRMRRRVDPISIDHLVVHSEGEISPTVDRVVEWLEAANSDGAVADRMQ